MHLRIRDLREDSDLSQEHIANMLHVTQSTYSRYERGALEVPLDVLVRLAQFYHTSTDYLLGLTDEKRPYPPSRRKFSDNIQR